MISNWENEWYSERDVFLNYVCDGVKLFGGGMDGSDVIKYLWWFRDKIKITIMYNWLQLYRKKEWLWLGNSIIINLEMYVNIIA